MSGGWVKLHRKIRDNRMLRYDHNALVLFIALLVSADRNGSYDTGRFKLAELTGLNPNTAYSALKRLEKAGMIEQNGNNRYTVINICNWSRYQASDNNQTTTRQQPDNNQTTLNKNKRIENKENTYKSKSDDIRPVYDLFIKLFERNPAQYKLTPKRRIKIAVRLRDAGMPMIEKAITNVAGSKFHRGDNDRAWQADLDWILRSYEQVERLSQIDNTSKIIEYRLE